MVILLVPNPKPDPANYAVSHMLWVGLCNGLEKEKTFYKGHCGKKNLFETKPLNVFESK